MQRTKLSKFEMLLGKRYADNRDCHEDAKDDMEQRQNESTDDKPNDIH
jgi:hypothetical protein